MAPFSSPPTPDQYPYVPENINRPARDFAGSQGGAVVTHAEQKRLEDARAQGVAWRKWGPYLSERQWGTVREDYSDSGDAWDYFTHD
jgi:hypothetical protein